MRFRNSLGLALSVLTLASMVYLGAQAKQMEYDEQLYNVNSKELNCLALNIYFEARGESRIGQKAIAWVTLNRVKSGEYENTICGVVWEKSQFSWTDDSKSDRPKDAKAYTEALDIANSVINEYQYTDDPTEGAVMFHSVKVTPYWKNKYERVTRIDNHIFYKEVSDG